MALIEYLVFGRVRRESDELTKINSSTTEEGLISAENGECDRGGDADRRGEKSPTLAVVLISLPIPMRVVADTVGRSRLSLRMMGGRHDGKKCLLSCSYPP